ncbi:sorting nexin-11 [Amia ocellicauda]|uniref:sorting nexin-11 n=1 Tax=Amia ocellicauda TaxID=2972642 RepID=UPI0034643013
MRSQEEEEFIAVRVQDPRVQSEGSWNSYVDFKIFLHTNSKAFTAKTSCVRRRYSEFVWLRKQLQKNAGLVPVPELPVKTPFFSLANEDFIERRRQGLQQFLDKLLHMTVFLSDSQLHMFLQTQLRPAHIEQCVQGHTPYSVTDAILSYASSNRGWAQEEEGGTAEASLVPVPYESADSPTPQLPLAQCECRFEVGGPENDTHSESDSPSESKD